MPPQEGENITCQDRVYRIGSRIGSGYFGYVFACTDDWGNDLVAKVIRPRNRPYEEIRHTWLLELQNLLTLRHPNITFVHDAFECDNTFYLIIERCSSTLDELIKWPGIKGHIWLLPVARCLLQAIHYIHRSGYVHKDIHPGNVFTSYVIDEMVPQQNKAMVFKVGDLGISRLESDIDIFNTILAQWMVPPEFLDPKEFGTVGRQVDIYHAGLLLLSLLLGCVPTFTRAEVLAGKPRELCESLNSPYSSAISKALRRHVGYRIPTAIEFWYELSKEGKSS